jgi:uncharacterized protein (DUF1778 family)
MGTDLIAAALQAALARATDPDPKDDLDVIVTFRATAADRLLLTFVADHLGESRSSFIRNGAVDLALAVIDAAGGLDTMKNGYRARHDRRVTATVDAVTGLVRG